MSDRNRMMGLDAEMAAPLHLQRLERSVNVQPFLSQINDLFRDRARYWSVIYYSIYIPLFSDLIWYFYFSHEDNESSESSDGSETYLEDILTQKEGSFKLNYNQFFLNIYSQLNNAYIIFFHPSVIAASRMTILFFNIYNQFTVK